MKTQRTVLIILTAAFIILCSVAAVLYFSGITDENASDSLNESVIFALDTDDISEISVSGRQNYTLIRAEDGESFNVTAAYNDETVNAASGGVSVAEDEASASLDEEHLYTADTVKTSEMLLRLSEITSKTVIEDVLDFSVYGLNEPLLTIDILMNDGTYHLIEIGDFSEGASMYYTRFDEGSDVYLVTTLLEVAFDYDVTDLRQ